MPAIIDSAPDCIVSGSGTEEARVEDSADFVIGNNWEDCAGFMTFGPGSTYGKDGTGAAGSYMVLTWLGIIVMVAVIVAWVLYEDRRLWGHVARIRARDHSKPLAGPTDPPVME